MVESKIPKYLHPETRSQRYYARHREDRLKKSRDYRRVQYALLTEEEKEEIRQKNRERYLKNYSKNEDYRIKNRSKEKMWYKGLRDKVFKLLGNKCVNPFNIEHSDIFLTDVRCLQVDHIHGGGYKQRKQMTTKQYFEYILEHPNEFQLLCANCNQIKRYANDEFLKM
jgi:hypothetical protein